MNLIQLIKRLEKARQTPLLTKEEFLQRNPDLED